jgi:hypothetical protein
MMQKSLFEVNEVSSFGNVGVKPKDVISINPPPHEDRCECCMRLQSELKPFVDGVSFRFTKRPIVPNNYVIQGIFMEFYENCDTEEDCQKSKDRLVQKYGEKKAEYILGWIECGQRSFSYECRDCMSMDDYEYYERCLDNEDPPNRCGCCGRNIGELSPFTEGDAVMDHFNGKLLARRYRQDALPTGEVNKIMDELFGNCMTYDDHSEALDKLIQKVGKEEGLKLWTFAFYLDHIFNSSWECRNCIVLDTHQYLERKMAQEPDSGHDSPG